MWFLKSFIMKSFIKISFIASFIIGLIPIFHSCTKEKIPKLKTAPVSNIMGTSATCGGIIIDEGSGSIISLGVCWSTKTSPTVSDNKTNDSIGSGNFTSNITDLEGSTKYFIRAYATNYVGIGYGEAVGFTTLGLAPTVSTEIPTNITSTSVTLNSHINANYLSTSVSFDYGTTLSYGNTINAVQNPVTGNTNSMASADILDLNPGESYHFRVKAVNALGTVYGSDMVFLTLGLAPTVSTEIPTNITSTSVTLNSKINANFLSTLVSFDYGTTLSYGNTIISAQSPVTGNTITLASADILDLNPGESYHFRVKAVNALGTVYGSDMTFITLGKAPIALTRSAELVGMSARFRGLVYANYLPTTVSFEYGFTTSYGNTASIQNSIIGDYDWPREVYVEIFIWPAQEYHFRVKAVNILGTSYGNDETVIRSLH